MSWAIFILRFLYLKGVSIKKHKPMSFSGMYLEKRTRKNIFFNQMNILSDWSVIEKVLLKISMCWVVNAAGKASYISLLLFEMMPIQTWYDLNLPKVEDMVIEIWYRLYAKNWQIFDKRINLFNFLLAFILKFAFIIYF